MGGSMHPNVPFLAKHPAWGVPAETTTHSDSPSRAGGWDREGLGWSGFRTSDRLLVKLCGWWGLGVIAVVAVGSIVADQERLTEMLTLAVTPLAVLLGFSAQSWPEASSRVDPSRGEAAPEQRLALLLLGTAGAGSIIVILVHIVMPEGSFRHATGILATVLAVSLVLLAARRRRVLNYLDELDERPTTIADHCRERLGMEMWAKPVDWLMYSLLTFAIGELWPRLVMDAGFYVSGAVVLGAGWLLAIAAALFLYQLVTVGAWGCTLSHRMAGTRIVAADNGNRLNWKRSAARAAIFGMPLLLTYAVVVALSSRFGLLASEIMAAAIPVIASFYLAAAVHPRRQGIHDLVARAVAMKRCDWEPPASRRRS